VRFLKEQEPDMKLHLGCGKRFIPGFIHIDTLPFPHIDHVALIDELPFIETATVDLIYACHVVEHFKRNDLPHVLQEWLRVLKPTGVLRIAVPDFEALSAVYQETRRLDLVVGAVCGRQDHEFNIHYNIFDFNTLKSLLHDVGFVDAKRYDWQKTEHSDIDDFSQAYIPHMQKDSGRLISLNVEDTKPPL
jgi:predicted SAM-dependent methyltransferase